MLLGVDFFTDTSKVGASTNQLVWATPVGQLWLPGMVVPIPRQHCPRFLILLKGMVDSNNVHSAKARVRRLPVAILSALSSS